MLARVSALALSGATATASGLVAATKRSLRTRGWEIRRTDPDRSLSEHLWFLFPHLGINCVLDIGAGSGEYGAFLRQNGYAGEIVSFEPVAATYRRLALRCGPDPMWRAYPYALGSQEMTSTIDVTRDPAYSSFLRPSQHSLATFPAGTIERTEPASMRRLDEILADLVMAVPQPSVFLRTATQGCDLEVLLGAGNHLENVLALQIELSLDSLYEGAVHLPDAIRELNRAGFAASGFFDRPHHHGFRLSELECVMIRPAEGRAPIVRRW